MSEISIVVPVYNVEPYIHRCVDSILTQSFSDFELILVEDGSPDNCGQICDDYACLDERIIVIHQENRGLSEARNTGIEWALSNSKSHWLTFVDSDDWIHPEYLIKMYEAVCQTKCNVAMCFHTKTDTEGIPKDFCNSVELWTPEEAYTLKHTGAAFAYAWGRLYKKELFETIRFPRGKSWEDLYVTHKILFEQAQIAVVPFELYYYYINPAGITLREWTPAKWDVIEAREDLIRFFGNGEYKWLRQENIKEYVILLYDAVLKTQDNPQYKKHFLKAKRMLVSALKKYKEIYPFQEYKWLYSIAYPGPMKLYWNFKNLLGQNKE